jgi:very-short-patch-repair endonuclease
MALGWNEIKDRALTFSKEWETTANEEADAKPFLDAFFNVFGVDRRLVSTFEHRVKKLNEADGYIDLLWKGVILIEMKSRGKNLDKAFVQAKEYIHGLKEHELPKYILVSDFATFRLFDTEENKTTEFKLDELYKNVNLFWLLAGFIKREYKEQDPVNIKAADLMGKLHDRLKDISYTGHELEVYLVRLLFCLFAEDTTIFEKQQFEYFIKEKTREDGTDVAAKIQELFQVLNTPNEKRFKNTDEQLANFPYVNGRLFEEVLTMPSYDKAMRNALLECCYLDWSKISPAIFGSMFQSVMNPKERRDLGAHYTSEKNIMKVIKPLFLDELWAEFNTIKSNKNKLTEFHNKIAQLKFLDPACGCGNFLIITYRELRLLELEVLDTIQKGQQVIDLKQLILLNVDQFYGIEYEEFPARIAEVAMWLIDHQMNMAFAVKFGVPFVRLPLKKGATIVHGNALQTNWQTLLNPSISEIHPTHIVANNQDKLSNTANCTLFTPQYLTQNNIPTHNLIFSHQFLPYNAQLKQNSKSLRKAENLAEVLLWNELRAGTFLGHKFQRQKPILNYIVDFYCKALNLVIEIDGSSHESAQAILYDAERDRQMQVIGLTILRISDTDVKNNMYNALRAIENCINAITNKRTLSSALTTDERTPPNPLKEGEHDQAERNGNTSLPHNPQFYSANTFPLLEGARGSLPTTTLILSL